MLELLKQRLEELVAEKSGIECKSDAEAIAELVEAYRAEITAKYESDKAAKVADIDLEVKAIERLIVKEQAKAAEVPVVEVPVVEAPVIETPVDYVTSEIEG